MTASSKSGRVVVGLLAAMIALSGVLAAFAGNRVFVRKAVDGAIVNTNIVYGSTINASDLMPQGNFAAEVRMAGGGGGTGTGTVDYVKIQLSVDSQNWNDAVTIVDDREIAATNTTATVFTNLTGILPIAPYYRFATLVKDTPTVGEGTGVVVNAWIVIN